MRTADKPIEICDENGVVRIRMGVGFDGAPYFSLNDGDGLERLVLTVDSEGNGSVGFRASSGQPVADFGVSKEMGVGIEFSDLEKKMWLTVGLREGKGGVALETPAGIQVWPSSPPFESD